MAETTTTQPTASTQQQAVIAKIIRIAKLQQEQLERSKKRHQELERRLQELERKQRNEV
jgi:uncharacterized protein YigA (DUF484 family)